MVSPQHQYKMSQVLLLVLTGFLQGGTNPHPNPEPDPNPDPRPNPSPKPNPNPDPGPDPSLGSASPELVMATCKWQNREGLLRLYGEEKRTMFQGYIVGFQPGLHGIHIHETGNVTNNCKNAGPHYNPFNNSHGSLHSVERHMGDLGNFETVEEDCTEGRDKCKTNIVVEDDQALLSGNYNIIGRSIVVHEGEDDQGLGGKPESNITGHPGTRIDCCLIVPG